MKYIGMPMGMWVLFQNSFQEKLTSVLKYSEKEAADITIKARKKYRKIVAGLPEFEKEDRFKMNILSCAMLSAFILNLEEKATVEQMIEYYESAMMTETMKWFCRKMGTQKFTDADIKGMKQTAALNAADRNPYSWNMDYLPYKDGSGYEARFYKCGICTLMKELGLSEYTPAMCHLDYAMSDVGGVTDFIREYTLASGGPYCDCGYKKKRS
ncbi:MAG: L-2-amino-thiazoline-4-carboxylic acid hydrolase [Erysipelotrichaceae bacterium]|nr:L-2-amino-thiazoline-4-carboxylic acid hydrolase [Erysipelotrichaceae bacterium]